MSPKVFRQYISSQYSLDSVNISLLSTSNANGPLIVSPRWQSSKEFLRQWCEKNREWIDDMLIERGAILISGFDLSSPADMEEAIKAYHPELSNKYRGTSPRKLQDGTDFVFSAAEVPANYPIAQHIEMSFLEAPPAQLYFGCIKPSRTAGGETALCDFRTVAKQIPTDLKQKLLDKGIRYTRKHKKVGSYFTFDVADMLGWPQLFGTDSKEQVELICADEGIPVAWDGDTFVSITQSHAFQLHPTTGELVWFNHSQVFHWTTFPSGLWFAFQRTWDIRFLLHCIVISLFCIIKYAILGHHMSLHCTFGDGTPISVSEMSVVRNVIHRNMIFNRWNKGDILLIDNFGMSHGRQPTYDASRKIVVAWAPPVEKQNLVTNAKAALLASSNRQMSNPQEKSPSLTPTNDELHNLQEKRRQGNIVEEINENIPSLELTKHHNKQSTKPPILHVSSAEFWQEDD